MEDIARSDRQYPAKPVDPKADEGMGAKRASLYCKTHREGGGVPSRCCQALENCFPGSVVVQMKRLRIELRGELLDIVFRDPDGLALETHSQRQVFEPFDHSISLD